MFLPIGDEPNPRRTPAVTYVLIAANVAVFLLVSLPMMSQPVSLDDPSLPEYLRYLTTRLPGLSTRRLLAETSAYDLFTFTHGFRPASPSVATLFESLFLHGGWLHLIGNMLFLRIFGDNVEARLGRIGFLVLYLATGVAATLFFTAFQLDSQAPLVGASGAISGVLGCYFWWFPQNRVRVLVVLFFFIDIWRVPARIVLGIFLVVDNLLPLLVGGASGQGVAYGAHIGGFVAGFAAALALGRTPRRERLHSVPGGSLGPAEVWSGALPERPFDAAVRAGAWSEAASIYAHLLPRERLGLDGALVLALAVGLEQSGETQSALNVLTSFIGGRPTSPLLSQAHLQAGLIHLHRTGRLASAQQHLLAALDLDPPPPLAEAAREGLTALEALMRRHDDPPS